MNEELKNKKDLIILDFDHTIYNNVREDYSIDIDFNKIVPANYFFTQLASQVELFSKFDFAHNTQFFLISGRSEEQKIMLLRMLHYKGYRIDKAYLTRPQICRNFDENEFLIHYWIGKAKIINCLRKSQKFSSITIVDDSKVICSMLEELDFTIIRAELNENGIKFTPFNQKINYQLIEREVLTHG